MKVLVTGANGFLGRNLAVRLREERHEAFLIGRHSDAAAWENAVRQADAVVHLAGVNRPDDPADFESGNVGLTEKLCALLAESGRATPVIYSSSIQAVHETPYGRTKAAAETIILAHAAANGAGVAVLRLPNVFGKWARISYNSVIATFCHRVARGEDMLVHDPAAPLQLIYVDDVINGILPLLGGRFETGYHDLSPVYQITVGEVAEIIRSFATSRETLLTSRVGAGLVRALYSTYLSYLPMADFEYRVPIHADARGRFVEMLKTPDCGQVSYFTAGPGITRGDHYHHTKAEKFLVISGKAHFGFRHILSGERHQITVEGSEGRIVETIPGWTHNVTNVGEGELVVMLWANEVFNRDRPDTVPLEV